MWVVGMTALATTFWARLGAAAETWRQLEVTLKWVRRTALGSPPVGDFGPRLVPGQGHVRG